MFNHLNINRKILFFLLPIYLLLSLNCSAIAASVIVTTSRSSLTTNELITLNAGIDGTLEDEVDIYLALSVPGISDPIYMGPGLIFYTQAIPLISKWAPLDINPVPLLEYSFSGEEPEGDYLWKGFMVYSGSSPFDPSNLIGSVEETSFVFTKHDDAQENGIINWMPQDGSVFYTEEPDLFLQFSNPVDTKSLEKIEISMRSLSSGKAVSVYWNNGVQWADITIPNVGTISTICEDNFIEAKWTENNTKITYHVGSYTLYGQTFKLNAGVEYELTFNLLEGAFFEDGTSIPATVIGPLTFSIAD